MAADGAGLLTTLLATIALLAPDGPGAPLHNAPPPAGDLAAMALARAAVGKRCQWRASESGPHVPGFTELKGVGQTHHPEGTVVLRQHGAQRVAFMAAVGETSCRILDAQPLPARTPREEFEQCEVVDPRPEVNDPIASGLGLHENGRRRITYFLEADFKARRLIARDPAGDRRIRCSGFESGD